MPIYLDWLKLREAASCSACHHTRSHVDSQNKPTNAHKASAAVKEKNFTWSRFYVQTYLSSLSRHLTKIGRIPDFIKSSIGGFLSLESSFLKHTGRDGRKIQPVVWFSQTLTTGWCVFMSYLAAWTALSCIAALSLVAF